MFIVKWKYSFRNYREDDEFSLLFCKAQNVRSSDAGEAVEGGNTVGKRGARCVVSPALKTIRFYTASLHSHPQFAFVQRVKVAQAFPSAREHSVRRDLGVGNP